MVNSKIGGEESGDVFFPNCTKLEGEGTAEKGVELGVAWTDGWGWLVLTQSSII